MPLLTLSADDLPRIAEHEACGRLVVVTLCAAWCTTCTEFRATIAEIEQKRPDVAFLWLDVEDDAEVCGDIDVESFPTLLAFRDATVLHYGTSVPIGSVVTRLVDALAGREAGLAHVPPEAEALRRAIRSRAGVA